MNLIIVAFLYLGLTYPGDTITTAERETHAAEVEQVKDDPEFLDYYDMVMSDGGTMIIDIHCGE